MTRAAATAPGTPPAPTRAYASLRHPLCGAGAAALLRLALANGTPDRRGGPAFATALVSALVRAPASLVERLSARAGPVAAPLFVLGHWRSGTTHLQYLLARDPAFATISPIAAGLPWNYRLLGRGLAPLLRRAIPSERGIDRVAVGPDSPQEDEIPLALMGEPSYLRAVFFPSRFEALLAEALEPPGADGPAARRLIARLERLYANAALDRPGRTLLVKNPAHMVRLPALLGRWPQARFVHLRRDPTDVLVSTRSFFVSMLETYALQNWTYLDLDSLVIEAYERVATRFAADRSLIPSKRIVEVHYDELCREPLRTLETIYDTLGLPGFVETRPAFEAYLTSVRGYERNRHAPPPGFEARLRTWRPADPGDARAG